MDYNIHKSLSKKELAHKLRICSSTLSKWLNVKYYDDLFKLGYNKQDKILTPPVLRYLFEKLDV